jgi:integrase
MFSKDRFNKFKMEHPSDLRKAVLTTEEYDRLIRKLENKDKTQLKMIIELIIHSGMRVSEFISLQVKDVVFDKGISQGLAFLKKRKRKGACNVLIDEVFLPALEEYRDRGRGGGGGRGGGRDRKALSPDDYWFLSSLKKPYT